MKRDVLLSIIAEWLEEWETPSLVSRRQPAIEPADLKRILAIVGPRRAGKTYYMYQLIQTNFSRPFISLRDGAPFFFFLMKSRTFQIGIACSVPSITGGISGSLFRGVTRNS